jgi:hypothetical protein
MLTLTEIFSIAKFCKDDSTFIYSSADGVKPMMEQLKYIATNSEVVGYFEREGFVKADAGNYKKYEKKIELTRDEESKITMAILLVFLRF